MGARPSPAIVVAVLALVAAVAGTAVAGPGASTSKITKKKVTKIADKEIKKLAPGLSVAHADTADTANTAGNATQLGNVTYVKGPENSVPADTTTHLLGAAICPAGSTVVGGGHTGSSLFRVAQSYPTADNGTDPGRRGWTVLVQNTFGGGGAADGRAVAICVEAAQTSGNWP